MKNKPSQHRQALGSDAFFDYFFSTKQHLDILVKDNGKGFSAGDTFRFGNGVHNMEKRMKRIGGRFIIESYRPGEGTSVTVAVDL